MQGVTTPESERFLDLLHQCFGLAENRRAIIMNWHALTPKPHPADVSDHLSAFIKAILYAPISFMLYKNYFTLFGSDWPVYRQWIATPVFWETLEANAKSLFANQKECANGDYVLSGPTVNVNNVVTRECRRQLVRDFVWLVRETKHEGVWLNLIVAMQDLLEHHTGQADVWLSTLHAACQGKCQLDEVPCWDVNTYDQHSSIKK